MNDVIANAVLMLIPMVLSLTVHEFAHAFAAKLRGHFPESSFSQVLLAQAPVSVVAGSDDLKALFADPVFQLK